MSSFLRRMLGRSDPPGGATGKPFKIQAEGGNATVMIYGPIDADGFGVSAADFLAELAALGPLDRLDVRLNSGGGAVFEGLAIYNAICRHPARSRVTHVDGIAASIASLIAMAGDHVLMAENAMLMIHSPWAPTGGNSEELRKTADTLDQVRGVMLTAYQRSGKSADELIAMMREETWLTAKQAVEAGFADDIEPAQAALANTDLSKLCHVSRTFEMPKKFDEFKPAVDAAAVAAHHAAQERNILARNATWASAFRPFMSREGVPELFARLAADPTITDQAGRDQLLALLGSQCEPLGGGEGYSRYGHQDSRPREYVEAATDALLLRSGVRVANPHPAARDLARTSTLEMARTLLNMAGHNASRWAPDQVLGTAFRAAITHTSDDFPYLLQNVAEKAMMTGYEGEPASHRAWVREGELNDFKPALRTGLSDAPTLLQVNEGGEYTYGTFGDRGEFIQLVTFGRMFSITRQALINDDLQAFTRLPQAFGASARRRESDEVYKILNGNPVMSDGTALFHANHKNLMTGAPLSTSGLDAARAAMRKQTGPAGSLLNLVPSFLIVPAALETIAETMINSIARVEQSNPGVVNPSFIRSLTLVVDPRLDQASATAWYLAASTAQVDTIEVAYLAQQRGLYTETKDGWTVDGMEFKARLDFAAAAIDWRGLIKNPGV